MGTERFYTHSIVSYASLDELRPLFDSAKHYAYILHDQDSTDKHYHIVATFSIQQSISRVRKLVESSQNTFSQPLKDLECLLEYFTHSNDEAEKFKYSSDQIFYDDVLYWKRRLQIGDVEDHSNDMFVDDLVSNDMTYEFMARKYGRDFMKNYKSYMEFRRVLLIERTNKYNGSDYNYNPYT